MGDWLKAGSAPDKASALQMERMPKDAGKPAIVRRDAGFGLPGFLSAGPSNVLVPELALEQTRQCPEDTAGLGLGAA